MCDYYAEIMRCVRQWHDPQGPTAYTVASAIRRSPPNVLRAMEWFVECGKLEKHPHKSRKNCFTYRIPRPKTVEESLAHDIDHLIEIGAALRTEGHVTTGRREPAKHLPWSKPE